MLSQEKVPSQGQVREFVIAGHGNFEKVKQMLADNPHLLNSAYPWNENDRETAIQASAQVGNAGIAEYLLEKGAPLDICTAAMLGRKDEVERSLREDPSKIHATGAHGIPLLPHAVLSGNIGLVTLIFSKGAKAGTSLALHNAVLKDNYEIVRWLVENASPDINGKNYEGKTPLAVAKELNYGSISSLLREHGGME